MSLPKWIDAKGFLAWLREDVGERRFSEAKTGDETFARRLNSWENSYAANTHVDTVDSILVRCFGNNPSLSDVPVDLFRNKRHNQPRRDPEVREEAVQRLSGGETPTVVARDYEVCVDTITKWRRAAA